MQELITLIEEAVLSLAGTIALVLYLTNAFKNFFVIRDKTTIVILSWIISAGSVFTGAALDFGVYSGIPWYWAAIVSVGTGLAANRIFSLDEVKLVLGFLSNFLLRGER